MLYYSHIAFSWWPLVLDSITFITKFLDYYIRLNELLPSSSFTANFK